MFAISNLVALGSIQGVLISLYLLFKSPVARLLGVFLALISINMYVSFYLDTGLFKPDMWAVAVWYKLNTYWLLGPLLLFYTQALTQSGRVFRAKNSIYLVPFVLDLVVRGALQSDIGSFDSLQQLSTLPLIERFSLYYLVPAAHFCAYLLFSSVYALNYWKKTDVSIATPQLIWLCLALGLSYFMMLGIFIALFWGIVTNAGPSSGLFVLANSTTLIILFIVPLLIAQFGLPESLKQEAVIKTTKVNDQYSPESKELLERLEHLMLHKAYYKDPNITQLQLAKDIGISRHQLSEILSLHPRGSFYELIGYLRVQAVKQEIQRQGPSENLLALAHSVGFNSKSSFNSAFKKFEGKTPSQYRKEIQK